MSYTSHHELIKLTDEVTTTDYGYFPDRRPLNVLLDYGIILLDKPAGPTSHEVVSWVKKILNLKKAGHSGTLDPGATGLLPVGLGDATKALGVLLLGPKEYYAVARLHSKDEYPNLENVLGDFMGEIYQRPPQRSSVRRATRIRAIYELELSAATGKCFTSARFVSGWNICTKVDLRYRGNTGLWSYND